MDKKKEYSALRCIRIFFLNLRAGQLDSEMAGWLDGKIARRLDSEIANIFSR